jgi:putative ATP-dependent endonuclease of OLD family
MQISRIKINDYRLLKEFSIDLEQELSLVIGKNNTGKTSLLSILDHFLSEREKPISYNDFNLDYQDEIKAQLEKPVLDKKIRLGFGLRLYIDYSVNDNLGNISDFMLNLDPNDNCLVLSFSYEVNYHEVVTLKNDYEIFKSKFPEGQYDFTYFLKRNHTQYFKRRIRSLERNKEDNCIEIIDKSAVKKIVNFRKIAAKRNVSNQEGGEVGGTKTLSRLSSRYYEKLSNTGDDNVKLELQKKLIETDNSLSYVYANIFDKVVKDLEDFGVSKQGNVVEVRSELQDQNLLKENTNVVYQHETKHLPEHYNGLGYMNLFAMIFEIHVIINEFKKKHKKHEVPADINLLFIEEPEAHTHPQLQYIFIKNIKTMLERKTSGDENERDVKIAMQTMMSTHSPHIVSEGVFNDIKYLLKEGPNHVGARNLSSLEQKFGDGDEERKQFNFLKQYLTVHRSELFFSEKAIFIEGATERILMPTMMKMLDVRESERTGFEELGDLPLLSQNISVVEIGAHSHVFSDLINFLGIKVLIITDIDSVKKTQRFKSGQPVVKKGTSDLVYDDTSCPVQEGEKTSNAALKFFFHTYDLTILTSLNLDEKVLDYETGGWGPSEHGQLSVRYQTEEAGYHARSFEDSFIALNKDFIVANKDSFLSLKLRDRLDTESPYEIAKNCVEKKSMFAMDILYNTGKDYDNWQVPEYIKEGLEWLRM